MLEEIKQRHINFAENPNTYDWIEGDIYLKDVNFLLQELEKLQQENERYKDMIERIGNTKTMEINGTTIINRDSEALLEICGILQERHKWNKSGNE